MIGNNTAPLIAIGILLWQVCHLGAQDDDLQALAVLRQQRKFEQVAQEVRRITAELGDRDFAKRVLLQIELIKSNTAQAFEFDPAKRLTSILAIIKSADQFREDQQGNPNLILVDVQKAVTSLRFGELIRMEIEAGVLKAESSKVAFRLLRESDRQFENIDKNLGMLIPARPKKTQDGALSQRQLISLQNQVRYQQIKSKINRGLLYGQDDPDNRVAILTTAKSDLLKVIPLIEKVDDAWWESRLDYLMCLRSVAEFRNAQTFFKSLPVKDAPPSVRLAIKAEILRLAIARKAVDEAEKLIASGREIDGQESADFDYAILEYFLMKRELARESDKPGIQNTLVKIVGAIEKKHGAYWGRRANRALVRSARLFGASGSRTFIRVAQDHYRKKEFDQSIEQFEKAAVAARKELNRKLELELRFQAVVIHRDLGQHQKVLEKSRSIGKEFRDTTRAASVHLLGILSAAELTRKGDLPAEQYIRMIDFHLENWSGHPTIGRVARFRGEFDTASGDHFGAALNLQKSIYAFVRPQGAIDLDAFEVSVRKLTEAFRNIARSNPGKDRLADFCQKFKSSDFFSIVEAKTSLLDSILNCWAIYALEIDSTQLPQILKKLLKEQKPQNETKVNLIRVAVATKETSELSRIKLDLGALTEKEKRLLLTGFELDWNRGSSTVQSEIAKVVTQCNFEQKLADEYWFLIAKSLITSHKRANAVTLLKEVQAKNPKLLQPRLMLAQLLSDSADLDQVRLGVNAWRTVLRDTKPQSSPWFRAKYCIAKSYHRLGDSSKALTILKLLKAVPPGWSKSELAPEFEKLMSDIIKKSG